MSLMISCICCKRICKSEKSLISHYSLCPSNPDRKTPSYGMRGRVGNNQYNKAKQNGDIFVTSEETKSKLSKAMMGNKLSPDSIQMLKDTINQKVINGTWHVSLAKSMHYEYAGCSFHGTWEVAYAKYLDEMGISWERTKKRFPYEFEGTIRRYTPDFYLPETDEYVEIKGFKTLKDEAKWSQFKGKLIVLQENELKSLGLI